MQFLICGALCGRPLYDNSLSFHVAILEIFIHDKFIISDFLLGVSLHHVISINLCGRDST